MKRLLVSIVLSLLACGALAQTVETTPPPPSAPHEARLPVPSEKTLANGLRVIVVQKPSVPLVAARLLIKTGGEADPEGLGGLADLTASLVTKGTKTRNAEQIARGVEALGATLESSGAWDDSIISMSVLSTNLPKALGYMADVAQNPVFASDEIERLREQNIDAVKVSLSEPDELANFVAARVVFAAAPYGHNLGGTPESLQRIKRDDIVQFHRHWYRPDNAILLLGGDISAADGFALATKLFGAWPKKGALAVAAKSSAEQAKPRVVVVDMPEAGQAAVVVARVGLPRVDPSYFPAIVANSVLGNGYSSRLNEEVRIKRGLSYGAQSQFELRRERGPFRAYTQTKNESAAEVAGLLVDELNRMATGDVPPAELTPRKATLIGDYGRSLETSAGLVRRIGTLALYDLSLDEINRYISGVEGVTAADVQKFSAAHLSGNDASVIIVGDASKFIDPLKKRFPNAEVIPVAQVDVNSVSLRK